MLFAPASPITVRERALSRREAINFRGLLTRRPSPHSRHRVGLLDSARVTDIVVVEVAHRERWSVKIATAYRRTDVCAAIRIERKFRKNTQKQGKELPDKKREKWKSPLSPLAPTPPPPIVNLP